MEQFSTSNSTALPSPAWRSSQFDSNAGIDPDQHKTELRPLTARDDPQQRLIYLAPADVGGHLGRPDGHFRCAVPLARRASHDGNSLNPLQSCPADGGSQIG